METNIMETLASLGQVIAEISILVLGLTHIIKHSLVSDRYAPIVALVIGVGTAFLFMPPSKVAVIVGITAALMSMGLYSGVKSVAVK